MEKGDNRLFYDREFDNVDKIGPSGERRMYLAKIDI